MMPRASSGSIARRVRGGALQLGAERAHQLAQPHHARVRQPPLPFQDRLDLAGQLGAAREAEGADRAGEAMGVALRLAPPLRVQLARHQGAHRALDGGHPVQRRAAELLPDAGDRRGHLLLPRPTAHPSTPARSPASPMGSNGLDSTPATPSSEKSL